VRSFRRDGAEKPGGKGEEGRQIDGSFLDIQKSTIASP
jgi:hypothetical protein